MLASTLFRRACHLIRPTLPPPESGLAGCAWPFFEKCVGLPSRHSTSFTFQASSRASSLPTKPTVAWVGGWGGQTSDFHKMFIGFYRFSLLFSSDLTSNNVLPPLFPGKGVGLGFSLSGRPLAFDRRIVLMGSAG